MLLEHHEECKCKNKSLLFFSDFLKSQGKNLTVKNWPEFYIHSIQRRWTFSVIFNAGGGREGGGEGSGGGLTYMSNMGTCRGIGYGF